MESEIKIKEQTGHEELSHTFTLSPSSCRETVVRAHTDLALWPVVFFMHFVFVLTSVI